MCLLWLLLMLFVSSVGFLRFPGLGRGALGAGFWYCIARSPRRLMVLCKLFSFARFFGSLLRLWLRGEGGGVFLLPLCCYVCAFRWLESVSWRRKYREDRCVVLGACLLLRAGVRRC